MKKTAGDVIILHKCTKNYDHKVYCSWDMAHDKFNCYFSFWAILCPFNPLTAQKFKISKKWKKHLDISLFTHVYQKLWLDDVQFLKKGVRWTDRWKKWGIEVGAPPKKQKHINFITVFTLKYVPPKCCPFNFTLSCPHWPHLRNPGSTSSPMETHFGNLGLSMRPAWLHSCRQACRQINLPAQLIVQAR